MSNEKRKLAAVLFADVVGFSRMMAADETSVLASLKSHLGELIGPGIAENDGRIVKMMGDGVLADFGSVVSAVACACDLQRRMAQRNASVSADRRIEFRMGINLGDVIVDDDDIFGDGVNIAARVQEFAEPGGVCISGKVFDEVRSKLEISYVDKGLQHLKNIPEPIRIYSVEIGNNGSDVASQKAPGQTARRPAVAVLPFANMSGDPEQEYFADGLTEDILTALTHWRSFPVIARNSSFVYKGKPVEIRQVARELGARYVVEGSVRKSGSRIRITAQLIDGESGHHIWADRYDRELDDIFTVQDEITQRVAATVAPELEKLEFHRSAAKDPGALDAWDCFLRGMALLHEDSEEGNIKGREMFERAIAIQPGYADAYAGLAYSHNRDILLNFTEDRIVSATKASKFARHAVKLDEGSALGHHVLATAYQWLEEQDAALVATRRAVELNPNDALVLHALGNKSDLAGDPEGIARMELAQSLNPQDPHLHHHLTFLSRAYVNIGEFETAVDRARKAIERRPDYPHAHFILALALAHMGSTEDAKVALQNCREVGPDFLASRRNWHPYVDQEANDRLLRPLIELDPGFGT